MGHRRRVYEAVLPIAARESTVNPFHISVIGIKSRTLKGWGRSPSSQQALKSNQGENASQ